MTESFRITAVLARQVLDSRAAPTVEAEVTLAGGAMGRAAVPSGASTGAHEALELRDLGERSWGGRGVGQAVRNAQHLLGPVLKGMDAREQQQIDQALRDADGTAGFQRLGANAALALSLAAARAAAVAEGVPFYRWVARLVGTEPSLPLPMVNMISGGAHAGGNLDIQDVLIVPIGSTSYAAGLEQIVRVYWSLRSLLIRRGHPPLVGDEGGFGPSLARNEDALALVEQAIELAGLRPGLDMALAVDVAASGFFHAGAYLLKKQSDREPSPVTFDAPQMIELVERWTAAYPIVSLEDPLAEDDWEAWGSLTSRLGRRMQLIGDDLFTTNIDRLQRGINEHAANAVLVKVNQIGTLSGALAALQLAVQHGYRTVISARSGETEDDWLADLAVGSGAGQIKVGSVARSERLAKYNRLLRIEEELGTGSRYGVPDWFPRA